MAVMCSGLCAVLGAANDEYEIGGPLAGVSLPLYKTEHGEEPGCPGYIPELREKGED